MAITINGSGTIGGVSVGGLPDGIVTASDLTSTLDLSSKTLTLPSGTGGKVLQVVQSGKFNSVSTTSTSLQYSSTNPSITPTYSSSKILLLWATSIIVDLDNDGSGNNNSYVGFEYQIGGTGGAWTTLHNSNIPARGGNNNFNHACQLISPNTTSVIYFRIGIAKNEGNNGVHINDNWGSNVLTMMEIAA